MMTTANIENILMNSCLLTLFLTMTTYWLYASLSIKLASVSSISMKLSNLILFSILILRWYNSQHFPLSNLRINI